MVRNGIKLYYPVIEMIKSILPIVDEFVIAVGKGDEDDITRNLIAEINDPKIKIIDTQWDIVKYRRGMEHAHQTDIAKEQCTGDWLFYLQSDEIIHENDLPKIVNACKKHLDDKEVEGLLFKYRHFWGDYNHYHKSHGWYPHEIRIVRNRPNIHSWESAQSFRRIPVFDGINYRIQEGTHKLNVALIDAYIYHYGWVRPPQLMMNKKKAFDTNHIGKRRMEKKYDNLPEYFDFGPMDKIAIFDSSHPDVMKYKIVEFDWSDKLQLTGKPNPARELHKHEKLKYKIVTFVEKYFYGGKEIGGFKNYKIIRK